MKRFKVKQRLKAFLAVVMILMPLRVTADGIKNMVNLPRKSQYN